MESQHTPGKFHTHPYGDGDIAILSKHEPDAIAILPYGGSAYEVRQKANADLFAAAPDLLEACTRLLSEITTDDARRYHCQRYGESHWMQSVDAARAAIAKAKGESQ